MTKEDWLDLTVLERRKYNCLSEVMDLSQQMGEALDRNDQVIGTVWPGKCDLYHAFQATLIPYLPPDVSIAAAVARQ